MKIVYLIPVEVIPAGGTRIIVEHCNRLAARGHEMFIATPEAKEPAFELKNVKLITIKEAQESEFDVSVGTGWGVWLIAEQIKASRKYGFCQMLEHLFFPPGAVDERNGARPYEMMVKIAHSTNLKVFTLSKWMQEFWQGLGKKDIPIIANGIDPEVFYPDPDPELIAFKSRSGTPCKAILIHGYEQNDAKNIKDAMTAAMRAQNTLPVQIWGFAPVEPQYRYAKYWQSPSTDEIRRIYSSADLLLQTTRYEARGSLLTIEAMACSTPVIVTQCGGVDDLIDGYNCLLVPYGDLDAIIDATKRVLTDNLLATKLRVGGLEYVRENLNWDIIIPQLEAILSE